MGANGMGRKAMQSEQTRATLMRVAREMFTTLGYADTPTEELVRRAGMTRGALYHQYRDKRELFRAVFEEVERELDARVTAAALTEHDPVARLHAGVQGFLDVCLDPSVQRIVLLDGPSVLGLQTWRAIDDSFSLKQIRAALRALVRGGHMADGPIDATAHLVVGALNQAAMVIAAADDQATARREMGVACDRLLDALLARPTTPHRPATAVRRVAGRRG